MKKLNRKPFTILENKQIRQKFASDMPAIRYPSYVGQYPSLYYSTTSTFYINQTNQVTANQIKKPIIKIL